MKFKDLLRYRKVWIGVAMMWIVAYHFRLGIGGDIFKAIKDIGYGGVDICLFASGIGCYFSLSANPDIGSFMKRRLKRVMPTYLVFIVFWLVYSMKLGIFGPQMALGNFLAVQNFTGLGKEFNWYIGAILLFYFFAPYFKLLTDRTGPVLQRLFLLFLIVLTLPFWGSEVYIITVTRFAVFYMGMLFAKLCKEDKRIERRHVVYAAVAFLIGVVFVFTVRKYCYEYLWSYGLHWYPFIFITIPLCMAISRIMMLLEKTKLTRKVISLLSLFGDYSLEIYLLHLPFAAIVEVWIIPRIPSVHGDIIRFVAFAVLAGGCFCLRKLTKLCELAFGKMTERLSRPQ